MPLKAGGSLEEDLTLRLPVTQARFQGCDLTRPPTSTSSGPERAVSGLRMGGGLLEVLETSLCLFATSHKPEWLDIWSPHRMLVNFFPIHVRSMCMRYICHPNAGGS